jgi:hypothetical protein
MSSTKRRLAKLEGTATPGPSDGLLLGLARLLGVVDATLTPPRWGGPRGEYGAAVDAIRTYHTEGVKFTSGSGQGAGHVADHRLRKALESAGWVTLRDARVKLTALGDRLARLAVGTALDGWVYQLILDRLGQSTGWDDPRPDGWRSEFDLFGRAGDGRDLDGMLPLLASGCVESISNTRGVVFYRATGQTWPVVTMPTKIDEAATTAYADSYAAALDQRQKQRHNSPEVFIPLPATR